MFVLVVLGVGWGVLIGSAIGFASAAAASGGDVKVARGYPLAGSRSSSSESGLRRVLSLRRLWIV